MQRQTKMKTTTRKKTKKSNSSLPFETLTLGTSNLGFFFCSIKLSNQFQTSFSNNPSAKERHSMNKLKLENCNLAKKTQQLCEVSERFVPLETVLETINLHQIKKLSTLQCPLCGTLLKLLERSNEKSEQWIQKHYRNYDSATDKEFREKLKTIFK